MGLIPIPNKSDNFVASPCRAVALSAASRLLLTSIGNWNKYIASDDHAGLKVARKAMFPGVPWQRCQFHLQHNAQGYVSRLDQRVPVARQIRGIFNAPDAQEAQSLLNAALKDWTVSHPQLAAWAEMNLPAGFAVFGLPEARRVRMRITHGLGRLNKELKRRSNWPCIASTTDPENTWATELHTKFLGNSYSCIINRLHFRLESAPEPTIEIYRIKVALSNN